QVVITARDVYKWKFTHTPEDYVIPPGKHSLAVNVVGTELAVRQPFLVVTPPKELPEGIVFSATLGKEEYFAGEPVDYRFAISNETDNDIMLSIPDGIPVRYAIDNIIRVPEYILDSPEFYDINIPAGGEIVYEGAHYASILMLKPGEYTMTLGLRSYAAVIEVPFNVTTDFALSDLSGIVVTPAEDMETFNPVTGAQVVLKPTIPKQYERDLSNIPNSPQGKWATVTGNEGEFLLTNVPLGMFYILEIWMEGFEPYQRTLRTIGADAELRIVLKPIRPHPVTPLNFKKRELENLIVAFGTGKTIYKTDAPFKVFLRVHNPSEATVSFTFDSEEYLVIAIKDMDNNILWRSTDKADKTAKGAAFMVDIPPGETHLFEYEDTLEGKVPKEGGKFIVEGLLNFTSLNIENIEPGKIGGFVKIIAIPPEAQRGEPKKFEAEAHAREMVIDFKEDLDTFIDMRMKKDDTTGEINISELHQNFHKPKPNHRFVKMIEIDADSEIRESLESAVIRIYYDEEEFGEGFDPEKLIIAHWHEHESFDSLEETDWVKLESRVDTINKFVEAETENISSFALFEPEETGVGVEDIAPAVFMLQQNSPNPFNPTTLIAFTLPEEEFVKLIIYNIMGQTVETLVAGHMQAGMHNIMFDGSSHASGVYFYRLVTPGYTATRKMLLIK
ncbi:MAG: T9SS type A sorting domain-containing protein, partial [Candidatus Latescibacteria bacterium]|nr:T9SS type A sorting domain-containing protein [Candidatus Latescibacterota bacterium]